MKLKRIQNVVPLDGFSVRLTLTDGSVIERDLSSLLVGPVFKAVRENNAIFRQVRAEEGTLVWAGGADLCPDTVIWGGPPPKDSARPPSRLDVDRQPHPA